MSGEFLNSNIVTAKIESAAGKAEAEAPLEDVLVALPRYHPTPRSY